MIEPVETIDTKQVTKEILINHLWNLANDEDEIENGRGKKVVRTTGKEKIQACELIAKMNGWVGPTRTTAHIGAAIADKLAGFLTDSKREKNSIENSERKLVTYVNE